MAGRFIGRQLMCIGLAALGCCLSTGVSRAQYILPSVSWSGPYLGLQAGGAWATVQSAPSSGQLSWGGHAGYGLHMNPFYIGIEADATYGGSQSSTTYSALYSSKLGIDWTASTRARVGVVVGGALVYLTGGLGWSMQTLATHNLGQPVALEQRQIRGHVLGAGVEMKLLPFASVRLEALRFDFDDQSERFLPPPSSGLAEKLWKGLDTGETIVRAGVSLRLN